ncbi:TetR/AcrR family transcriptional regulator [Streptomyces sp. NPDC048639]|uniref:TetR/AcrR family transcriptional regulator n=1 Tax=Streptomyces sp. NPDC048639 TaxID=3365581 RepID=UPI00371C2C65
MTAIRGARERARAEVTAAIKDEARRQLVAEGAAKLSLRAVARELGMVSSALYRYFPSRDALLTALIIDAFDAVGEAAEQALAASLPAAPADRCVMVCRAVRDWALAHPHEYALVFGSPVPGYSAPEATVGPASRVGRALIAVIADARADGVFPVPEPPPAPEELVRDGERIRDRIGAGLPAPVVVEAAAVWAELFGLIGFEVFGRFDGMIEARDAFFDRAVTRLAHSVGL